jgi:hypothetical protein
LLPIATNSRESIAVESLLAGGSSILGEAVDIVAVLVHTSSLLDGAQLFPLEFVAFNDTETNNTFKRRVKCRLPFVVHQFVSDFWLFNNQDSQQRERHRAAGDVVSGEKASMEKETQPSFETPPPSFYVVPLLLIGSPSDCRPPWRNFLIVIRRGEEEEEEET